MILDGYRAFYGSLNGRLPVAAERLRRFDEEKGWEESLEPGLLPYKEKVLAEMSVRTFDRRVLGRRLAAFEEARPRILELAASRLEELASAVELLRTLGFPFSHRQLGVSDELCLLPCRNVRLLRARYSSFDLAYELGIEERIRHGIEELVRRA